MLAGSGLTGVCLPFHSLPGGTGLDSTKAKTAKLMNPTFWRSASFYMSANTEVVARMRNPHGVIAGRGYRVDCELCGVKPQPVKPQGAFVQDQHATIPISHHIRGFLTRASDYRQSLGEKQALISQKSSGNSKVQSRQPSQQLFIWKKVGFSFGYSEATS